MRIQASNPQRPAPPNAARQIREIVVVRVQAVHADTVRVDVTIEQSGRPVSGVRVLQSQPVNHQDVSQVLPKVGDLGVIEYAHGNRLDPIWMGWLVPDDAQNLTEDALRTVTNGVSRVADPDGNVAIDVPTGSTYQIGATGGPLLRKSFIDTVDSRIEALENVIESALTAFAATMNLTVTPVNGTAVGAAATTAVTSITTAVAAARTAFEATEAAKADQTLKLEGA